MKRRISFTCECTKSGMETMDAIPKDIGNTKIEKVLVICAWVLRTMHRYLSAAIVMIITETMKTKVVGPDLEILHNQSVWSPQGQYLLRASIADNGIVAAKAKSVNAKLKINRFRGVRTCNKNCRFLWKYQNSIKRSKYLPLNAISPRGLSH